MNNEIKEILDDMFHIIIKYEEDFEYLEENKIRYQLSYNKMQKLYDYITNLQKTNKNHSKKLIELGNKINNLQQENERLKLEYKTQKDINQKLLSMDIKHNRELKDYKLRCEKADNQLKIIMQILKEQPNRSIKDDEWLENRLIGVEYILKNGGK